MALFGDVDTIQELSNILVSDSTDLLDISTGLGNGFDRVTFDNQFILLGSRQGSGDTFWDQHLSDSSFTQEVSDFNELLGVFVDDVDVDWEMRVNESHLVLVTDSNTLDQVGDQRLDGSQGGDVLSVTVVDVKLDFSVGNLFEGNVDVLQFLNKGTSWTSDSDNSGLDLDSDTFWNGNNFGGLDVLHL